MNNTESPVRDFPKLRSPFVRKTIDGAYVVTPEVDPDLAWVLVDPGVLAVEKIDGTNVCIRISKGRIDRVFNRLNEKDIFRAAPGTRWEGACLEGIAKAIQKDWLKDLGDGDHYGELAGDLINGNPNKLQGHLWVPFQYLKLRCHWKTWVENKYPKTYESISGWFRQLPSLFNQRLRLPEIQAEGIVFYHPDGRMAKLRRDMFDWFEGPRHGD